MKKYKLKQAHLGMPAGTIMYQFLGCTYGLCSDDRRANGREHIAVTEHEGKDPFLSTPRDILEEIP